MAKKKSKNVEKSKKLEDFKQSKPNQLTMFEMFLPEDTKSKRYSNTIDLYDFIPKYVWGKVNRIDGEFLRPIHREFKCRGKEYKVTILPAKLVDKDGTSRDYFPSRREELVEDALRKIAVEGQSLYLGNLAGVKFSLYQLQKELKKTGHSYSLDQIKDALQICTRTSLSVTSEDGDTVFDDHMFETVGLQTREDWKGTGKKTLAFVRFNFLITRGIETKTFRQINYEQSMSYKKVIARQLHKRMSHHYTQASYTTPYSILLTTIIRDFGIKRYKNLGDNFRDAKKALEEMHEKGVIMACDIEKIPDEKKANKMADVKFTLKPSINFVTEMKRFNQRQIELENRKSISS